MNLPQPLVDLVARCTHLHISTWAQWQALPPVTREQLGRFSYRERCVVPLAEVERIVATSGTSGRPPFLTALGFTVRSYDFLDEWYRFSKPIVCVDQNYLRLEQYLARAGSPVPILIIDPRAPKVTAALAQAAGADTLFILEPQLRSVGDEMARCGAAANIRFLMLGGGDIGPHVAYLSRTFPQAVLLGRYAASEVEGNPIGVPCNAVTPEAPEQYYHANTDMHLDIVDPTDGTDVPWAPGAEGDLLVSTPHPAVASPLIRYKIGDRVRVAETPCARHRAYAFAVLGRANLDFVKVQGGQLRVDELARTVRQFAAVITGEFELQYTERDNGRGVELAATLYLEPRGPLDWTQFAETMAHELRVGPSFTYAQGVARGWYAPLVCAPLPPITQGVKRKRLTRV